ncbi:MAG: hypothetical protein EAZ85_14275 [Bacteroidetes bacterium]|nr:MAG: hypothetical protein EAZ85_14275 [Bacteroidota bacterium]TAG90554.1 MAG: hypothetical protein EAZ20_04005 [Bacteroidota bacterium]
MLKYSFISVTAFALLLSLSFCGNQTQTNKENGQEKQAKNEQKNNVKKPSDIKTDRKFNDLARFIAGMKPEEGSVYEELTKRKEWINYAKNADAQWNNVINIKRPKLIKWRENELQKVTEQGGTLFYPFSGPDFLHAGTFFPEVENIVMIGLEPIGTLPDIDKIAKTNLGGYFNGLQRSLVTILQYSFFKTIDMNVDLTGRVVSSIDGTLPVIMLFMARTNHKILNYEKMALNKEGTLVPIADFKGDKSTYYATKIEYQRGDKPEERKTLYYLSVNLSNDMYEGKGGLNQRKDLKTFIENLDFKSVYLKSASYLMYKPYFSVIKNIILNKTKYLLQDDSGMAFNNFTNGKWDITLFGAYAGPISLFANYWQNDMNTAYKQKKYPIKPLPFGIGYQFKEGTSNLILVEKK